MIEAAAVVGRSFGDGAALELLGGDDRAELDQRLGALVRKQLVQPDGGRFAGEPTFSFKHIMMQDVAYQGILKEAPRRSPCALRATGWSARRASAPASSRRSSGTTSSGRTATSRSSAPIDDHGSELSERAAARLGASGGGRWRGATSRRRSACWTGRCRSCPTTTRPGGT